jgi:hypothetical protein
MLQSIGAILFGGCSTFFVATNLQAQAPTSPKMQASLIHYLTTLDSIAQLYDYFETICHDDWRPNDRFAYTRAHTTFLVSKNGTWGVLGKKYKPLAALEYDWIEPNIGELKGSFILQKGNQKYLLNAPKKKIRPLPLFSDDGSFQNMDAPDTSKQRIYYEGGNYDTLILLDNSRLGKNSIKTEKPAFPLDAPKAFWLKKDQKWYPLNHKNQPNTAVAVDTMYEAARFSAGSGILGKTAEDTVWYVHSKTQIVRIGQKYGLYSHYAHSLTVPTVYDSLQYSYNGAGQKYYLYALKDKKWGLIDSKNTLIFPFLYAQISGYDIRKGVFSVANAGSNQFALADRTGKLLSAFAYPPMLWDKGLDEEGTVFNFLIHHPALELFYKYYEIIHINNQYQIVPKYH